MSEFVCKIKSLFDRALQLKKEMAWILIGQALCFVGGFVGIKVLTNIMGPEGYGQLALGLTIAGLFNLFIYGPIANVVARFYSVYRERGTLGVYFSVLRRFHKILVLTLTLLSLLAGGVAWSLAGDQWGLLVAIASLFGIVGGVNASYLSLQSAMRDRKVVALHQGADVWIRIGLSILFLFLFQKSGYTALLGYLIGTLLVTISQNFYALKKPEVSEQWTSSSYSDESFREFYHYAVPFILWAGIAFVTIYGDRWILQFLFGEKEVGIYAAMYQIANAPINILFVMINQLVTPIIFERAGAITSVSQFQESRKLLRKVVLVAIAISTVLVSVIYVFSEDLVLLLTSVKFIQYHNVLWIIALAHCVFNIGQLMATKGLYCNKPKIYLLPKSIQMIAFVSLAFWLGSNYGIAGVAISLCLASFVHLVLVVLVNLKLDNSMIMEG
jgi:O-antigen/teichoic acid export membrane protein